MRPKSIIELTENLKSLYIKTAKKLKGSDRRQFMAEVVKGLGIGGQTLVERELGWNRRTVRKGMQELESGQPIIDGFDRSGRKGIETKLPNLLKDIKSLPGFLTKKEKIGVKNCQNLYCTNIPAVKT